MPDERELLDQLERWLADQPRPPTIFDVIATGNIELFSAFVLKGFRQAAAQAVEENERVARVRAALLEYYEGDAERMEAFLRGPHPLLMGLTPLQKSLRSDRDARQVIALARVDVVGTVLRVSRNLAKAWRLTDCEQARLLGVETAQMKTWQMAEPDELPSDVLERTSLLLGIFKAINTLLPIPERADAWIRKPNAAALFEGRAAIEVMMEGLDGMRQLHSYLNHQTG
jgi:hypothetical protein